MKRYSAETFLESLREIVCPNYDASSNFTYRFEEAINFIAPAKKIRMTANTEPWFDKQILPAIQRRDKAYEKFKHSGLETD